MESMCDFLQSSTVLKSGKFLNSGTVYLFNENRRDSQSFKYYFIAGNHSRQGVRVWSIYTPHRNIPGVRLVPTPAFEAWHLKVC